MKIGDLVKRAYSSNSATGILFQDGYNLMILWSNGIIKNSCDYFAYELEVVNENR